MTRNQKFPYKSNLRMRARQLRKEGTLGEVLLWQQLRAMQFGVQFRRQVPVGRYIVDFYCHRLKLAIEIDGRSHEMDSHVGKYDLRRQQILEALGIKVIRFTEEEVRRDLSAVVDAIAGYVGDDYCTR